MTIILIKYISMFLPKSNCLQCMLLKNLNVDNFVDNISNSIPNQ